MAHRAAVLNHVVNLAGKGKGALCLTPRFGVIFALVGWLWSGMIVNAATPEEGNALLLKGEVAKALAAAEEGLKEDSTEAEWHELKLRALLEAGRYQEASEATKAALEADDRHLPLLWTVREALRAAGEGPQAEDIPRSIERLFSMREWAYREVRSLIVFGKVLLLRGTDPKLVQDRVFAVAQKLDPQAREPFLARGELALEKGDGALAAKAFREGLKVLPDDPDLWFGLAKAFSTSDRKETEAALTKALAANPRHVPSSLFRAENCLDREAYAEAEILFNEVAQVNPHRPELWAYRAVLAHLRNDQEAESQARGEALKPWPGNPLPDHLYGRKLSQKYRFAEGAAAQKRALDADPNFLPAKSQLASDLLRLGDEREGWRLAEAVNKDDAYNVTVHNLLTLHDLMQKDFTTLTTDHFTVRMSKSEAQIYGDRVLRLLEKARITLSVKYGVEVTAPTVVEIFPNQKDFGVRTFGMPDNPGYLGVCFGRVVTANSPASNRHPVSWESVLWHEFCHTVTLQATRNRMPRWLSEGISVYEERQADAGWGEKMTPEYREMILGEDLTPVGELSGAFLAPKTPEHLMFAYFESSLVVEYIIAKHGAEALRQVLQDLRDGTTINAALSQRVAPIEQLEKDFAEYARQLAKDFGQGLTWDRPSPEALLPGGEKDLADWQEKNPLNYWKLMRDATQAVEKKDWAAATAALQSILKHHPHDGGDDGALALLAHVQKQANDVTAERQTLQTLVTIDAAVPKANARLIELATQATAWPEVAKQAERWLAVNPLIPAPWKALAQAAKATQQSQNAISAWQTLLALDPPDSATLHFQLAQAFHEQKDPQAKRHLLLALEENPRHREALALLLKME